jgi:hypothetical protein
VGSATIDIDIQLFNRLKLMRRGLVALTLLIVSKLWSRCLELLLYKTQNGSFSSLGDDRFFIDDIPLGVRLSH